MEIKTIKHSVPWTHDSNHGGSSGFQEYLFVVPDMDEKKLKEMCNGR